MTQRQLTTLGRRWIKRFPLLASWKIRFRFAVESDMPGELGRVEFWPEMGEATVKILRPEDRSAYHDSCIEADIVHELLHIVLDGHKPGQKYDIGHERAINSLAEVLYSAYHRRR